MGYGFIVSINVCFNFDFCIKDKDFVSNRGYWFIVSINVCFNFDFCVKDKDYVSGFQRNQTISNYKVLPQDRPLL
jgi:hypothetical protein